jgi:hypothetical protein
MSKKQCTECGEVKDRAEFYSHQNATDGLRPACKLCSKARTRRDQQKSNPYLSPSDYAVYLEAQGGCCAICRTPAGERWFDVDHCHEQKQFRGLLCRSCNVGLGMFKDNAESLHRAIEYLSKT